MSKRKEHAPVYEGEQSGTKRLPVPDEMKIVPTSSHGSFLQPEDPLDVQRIKEGVVSKDELDHLAVRIINWKSLAHLLCFTKDKVGVFDDDNVKLRDKVYSMLILWKDREGSRATFRVLHDALCHRLVNRQDLAEEFCLDGSSSLEIGRSSSRGRSSQFEDRDVQRIKEGVVSSDELDHLAVRIINWKSLAHLLWFTEDKIRVFDDDNVKLRDKVYRMLMAWKAKEGLFATYRVLHDALCNPLVRRPDLAAKFCIYERPFLSKIPSEIKAQGPRAQLAYENALKSGKVKVYRTRIMLIGQDRAGKTSLMNGFLGVPFNNAQQSTDGIDVKHSKFEFEIDQVTNWQLTNEKFAVPQFLDEIAREAAKHLKNEEAQKKPYSPISRETNSKNQGNWRKKDDRERRPNFAEPAINQLPVEGPEHAKMQEAEVNDQAKKIPELSFDPSLPPDEYIRILQRYLEGVKLPTDASNVKGIISLDLWDFAGQHLYYASYPVFLSLRAVYMLVYNLSKGLKQPAQPCVGKNGQEIPLENPSRESNIENMLSWLATICTMCWSEKEKDEGKAIAEGRKYLRPPVFIVGTHADTPYEDIKKMKLQIEGEIKGMKFNSHVIAFHAVDNTKGSNDERLAALKNHLIEVLKNEPYMGEEIPLRWLNFEKVISALTEKNVHYLEVKQLQFLAREKCFITAEEEFELMMTLYHDLGIIIKQGTTVILDAKWLIELFRQLITIPDKCDSVTKNQWQELEDTGILSKDLTERVFKQFCLQDAVKQDILELMEHFGLIAEISTSPTNVMYFVPAQVKAKDEPLRSLEPSCSDPTPLYIDFHTGFVPHGLFAQIVCRSICWVSKMVNQWKESSLSPPPGKHLETEPTCDVQLCQNEARLFITRRDSSHCLKLICKKRYIKIVLLKLVKKAEPNLGDSSNEVATQVLEFLKKTLQDLSEQFRYLHGLRYKLCVACPSCVEGSQKCKKHETVSCKQDACLHLVEVKRYGQMICKYTYEVLTVNGIERWFSKTTEEELCRSLSPQSPPDDIKEGLPTEGELEDLSRKLEEWKPLGRQLGFEGGDLKAVDKDNEEWSEKKFEMLKKWRQWKAKDATYRVLYDALCHVRRTDLAQAYCCH